MYGYEREGIPPKKAFKKEYAFEALVNVKRLVYIMKETLYNTL